MILFSERKKSNHILIHAQKSREYCSFSGKLFQMTGMTGIQTK